MFKPSIQVLSPFNFVRYWNYPLSVNPLMISIGHEFMPLILWQSAKVQISWHILAVSPEPSLLEYTDYGCTVKPV